jgi:hypothetical protein
VSFLWKRRENVKATNVALRRPIIYTVICFEVGYLTTLLVSRLYNVGDRIINECGAAGGMRIGRGNRCTQLETSPVVPLCPPQIPHGLTLDRTQFIAESNRRLTTGTTAQPRSILDYFVCSGAVSISFLSARRG